MSYKIKEQEYFLWQSMIPELRKNIDQCIKEIKQKPIFTCPPEDMEIKINKIKCIFEEDNTLDEEQFLDVFAFFIEQKVNITLLELADLFSATFGKDNTFWTQKITHWANMHTFTNSLIIWNVTQFLRNFINYMSSPLERDFIYQWRQKVHAYLSSLEFLVRKIQKLKRTDSPYTVDESYIKYHKQKMLYMTFVNKFGIKNSNDDSKMSYHDEVTITFQNKSRAQKKLFNFPHATRTIDDMQNYASKQRFPQRKSANTLQRYNFTKQNPFPVQQYDQNQQRQRTLRNREQLIQSLSNIGKNYKKQMNQLRDELMNIHASHRQYLRRQKQRLQNNLREHVEKLTMKKKLIQRQRQKQKKLEDRQRQEDSMRGTKQQMKIAQVEVERCEQTQVEQTQQPIYYQVMQQQQIDTPEFHRLPMSHAVFIHNPEDYYSFQGHPIGDRNIPVSNPFALYPWINYYVNDREEYEDFMAISLDSSEQLRSDSDAEDGLQEEEEQEGLSKKDDDSYFIDRRTIITPDNVEWEKLAPEDRMKFDQIITEDRIRWIAQYKHQDSSQLLSRFTCLPIYGSQLPYMIIGPQNPTKSKRKLLPTKGHNASSSISQKIEVITTEIFWQDDSATMKKAFIIGNEQTTIYEGELQMEHNPMVITNAINDDVQI